MGVARLCVRGPVCAAMCECASGERKLNAYNTYKEVGWPNTDRYARAKRTEGTFCSIYRAMAAICHLFFLELFPHWLFPFFFVLLLFALLRPRATYGLWSCLLETREEETVNRPDRKRLRRKQKDRKNLAKYCFEVIYFNCFSQRCGRSFFVVWPSLVEHNLWTDYWTKHI